MQQKSDMNQRSWENSEFPILCEGWSPQHNYFLNRFLIMKLLFCL
jgi:hypothetical protein